MRRALRFGQCNTKGLAHRFLDFFGVRNAVGPFGDGLHERNLVHVLCGIAFAHHAFLHTGDADHRYVALECGGGGGDDVGDARAFGDGDYRGFVGGAGKAVGHERGTLFVAGQDEADLRRDAQFVEDGEVLCAGNAEDMIDAFAQQAVD